MITGRCLCGDVRYELDGPIAFMNTCHCSICRRITGTAYGVFAQARADGFRWIAGEERLRYYESSAGTRRSFCGRCGAKMPIVFADLGHVTIPAGTLDGDPGVRPAVHVHVASKAPWFEITDALPRRAAGPGDGG